jgi:tetratricopeptide (TPR) repeat protein
MSMTSGWTDAIRRHVAEEDIGKAGRALALAMLTVLAATVAGLQGHASLESARAGRVAEQIALDATGASSSSVIQVGAAYGIYRRWLEQHERSGWAGNEAIKAAAAERERLLALQRIDLELAGWITSQTPLLQPPFHDPGLAVSDAWAFEAEMIVRPSAIAAERRATELTVAAAWQARASGYITALTVIAVGLFFVGLASTVTSGRRFLAGAGVTFGIAAAAWSISIAMGPIPRVPAEAIEHLAAAQAAVSRAPLLSGTAAPKPEQLAWYQTAIDEASAAIALDATYESAYLARGGMRVLYGDELVLSGAGHGVDTDALLRAGMADYRRYLESHPDDYAAWWNLGWAGYLVGDHAASIEATSRALELAPTQFTLHLNRGLARISGGDRAGAELDVQRALELAAADTSDTASWYLGQSDFDLGRLAELHPDDAEVLASIQLRLREAQVALRVLGRPVPDATAPEPSSVTLRAIDIGRYAGGRITEGQPITPGAHVATTDAVGVRVVIDGDQLAGHHVSARLWVNGLPRPDYVLDATAAGSSTTLDVISPYGRAGADLEPGAYSIDVYVDGSRRFTSAWTVSPRPSQPAFTLTATALLAALRDGNFTCAPGATTDGTTKTQCDGTGAVAGRVFFVEVNGDDRNRLTWVVMTARTAGADDPVGAVGPSLFKYVVGLIYPPDLVPRAEAWIDDQDDSVNDIELGGTTLRVFGATETDRRLDIFATWPEGGTTP